MQVVHIRISEEAVTEYLLRAASPAMTDAEKEVENEDINVMTVANHVLLQGLISGIKAGVDNDLSQDTGVYKCPDLSPFGVT